MAIHVAFPVLCLSCILSIISTNGEIYHQKYEYKYSFKGPYLAQKDGSVPFWEYAGSTIASEESARITPSLKSKKGLIWTKNQTNFEWWMVEFVFRVTGRGRVGADGLAFWFTEEKGVEGPVFGSNDKWRGLGVFFDSFDNDNKHNNPYIMAIVNDGNMMFDHQNDGANQQLAGCLRDYRNKPYPVKAKVEYYKNILTVMFHGGMTNNEQDYEMCLRVENVFLPRFGHFGLSAATGGLADDHDVLQFLTFSLATPESVSSQQQQAQIAESERAKLSREFEDFKSKLDQQKEDFRKEHPDKARDPESEDWFESDNQRELRQIFTGQSHMFEVLRELHRKMDEIIGRQERTLSLMGAIQAGGGALHPTGQPQTQHAGQGAGMHQQPFVDTIRRHEVEAVMANQMEMVGTAREIKAFVTEIHQKSNTILTNQGKGGGAGYDTQNLFNELRDSLNGLKKDFAAKSPVTCPTQAMPNCISTSMFLVFLAIHLILVFGYLMYRDNREAQAKKFY